MRQRQSRGVDGDRRQDDRLRLRDGEMLDGDFLEPDGQHVERRPREVADDQRSQDRQNSWTGLFQGEGCYSKVLKKKKWFLYV